MHHGGTTTVTFSTDNHVMVDSWANHFLDSRPLRVEEVVGLVDGSYAGLSFQPLFVSHL